MGGMNAKLSRFCGREYRMGQDTLSYDSAELDSDPDIDSDEINSDTQKPPLVAEFSCHRLLVGTLCLQKEYSFVFLIRVCEGELNHSKPCLNFFPH